MKLAKTLTIMAFATLLSMGAMGSAGHAYAQDAAASAQDDGGNAAAAVAAPDMKTKTSALNFGGCWDGSNTDGSLQDQNYGSGYGWIGIVQKGAKIKGGNRGSYFEFVWTAAATGRMARSRERLRPPDSPRLAKPAASAG